MATVPEPSTWAMMLLGFAGLGFAGYRRTAEGPSFDSSLPSLTAPRRGNEKRANCPSSVGAANNAIVEAARCHREEI
jgi:hypothetical protein